MKEKEFEKQTLEQLLNDIKDIDNYKSFRNGAFVYDLGYYQGQLLLQKINRLINIINKGINKCEELADEIEAAEGAYSSWFLEIEEILKGEENEI